MAYEHLKENVRHIADLSDKERINWINRRPWIGYRRATEIMEEMEALISHPKVERMPCILIVSQSNNGKTKLVKKFVERHPAYDNPEGEGIIIPALMIQAPPTADPAELYCCILSKLFAPFSPNDKFRKMKAQATDLLRKLDVRVLIVDEIHDILKGSISNQKKYLGELKNLTNEVQMPIVAVGTKDALRAFRTDIHLWNRFEVEPLPKWKNDNDFKRLLVTFKGILPLRESSNFAEANLIATLYSLSEGTIGELARLLRRAAIFAIKAKVEKIDLDVIQALKYKPPSKRKKDAEGVV